MTTSSSSSSSTSFSATASSSSSGSITWVWTESPESPVIVSGEQVQNTIWNDPSVIKEGDTYRMWLSGGVYGPPTVVHVYEATSPDRITWTIETTPVLSPSSNPSDWDSLRIETPSVVNVGGVYHMYFNGCDGLVFGCGEPGQNGTWALGHAISADGANWIKDANNPLLHNPTPDPGRWGYPGIGEPGAMYNYFEGKMFLYLVGGKVEDTGFHGAILLATSDDGSNFTWYADESGEPIPVVQAGGSYPLEEGWVGMSSPMAFTDSDGIIHLFYSVFAEGFRQAAIGHSVSIDGKNFFEADRNVAVAPLLSAGGDPQLGAWNDTETWGPTAMQEPDGTLDIWFAGKKEVPNQYFFLGIGFSTGTRQ